MTIPGWAQGNSYSSYGKGSVQGAITPNARPQSLTSSSNFYTRSKPQYEEFQTASFLSVRSYGARGDGVTDDTANLQNAISKAQAEGLILYIDAGTYKVTSTINIPSGSRIVGETYPVIMAGGNGFFTDINNPQVVLRVGQPGETGTVELSDMIISTQGAQSGAILIEWNLEAPSSSPAGMWDVHTRVGGFAGSQLQVSIFDAAGSFQVCLLTRTDCSMCQDSRH
jgi:glucan 1,3-beta-glucosidase